MFIVRLNSFIALNEKEKKNLTSEKIFIFFFSSPVINIVACILLVFVMNKDIKAASHMREMWSW